MSTDKSKNDSTENPEPRMSVEDNSEAIRLKVGSSKIVPIKESSEENFGVELVTMISEISSLVDKDKKTVLYQSDALADLTGKNQAGNLGKSFRTKDLDGDDLTEFETMPTLEEQWIRDENRKLNQSWLKRLIIIGLIFAISAGTWAIIKLGKDDIVMEAAIKEFKEDTVSKDERDKEYYKNQLRIIECIKSYLEASNMQERAKFCRNPESTLSKMKGYFDTERLFKTYHFDEIKEYFPTKVMGKDVTLVRAKVSNPGEETAVKKTMNLLIVKQADGTQLIDWDTAVAYQPNDWATFLKNRSTEPNIFRVEVENRINHGPYLYDFSDDSKFQAYKVKLRGNDTHFLLAYAKKGSEVNKMINQVILKGGVENSKSKFIAPMILKLVFPKNAESDQCVEIIEVVSDSWFLP